jgi:hypothetical protein
MKSLTPGPRPSDSGRRSRTMLLLAGGFLVLVVICLFIVVFSGGDSDQPQNGQPNTAPPAVGPPASPESADQTIPTSAPSGVTWTFFRGVALPHPDLWADARRR